MTTAPCSLVTGCAGLIGSHLAAELLRRGHDVIGLDDLSGGRRAHVPDGVRFTTGSTTDTALVQSLFDDNAIDYVFHLAAYAAEGLSHFVRRFNYENNVLGSVSLINAAATSGRVRAFVFTSSIAVYGRSTPPVTELTPPAPIDPYGVAKLAVELDLRAASALWDLPWVIVRPHNVYGEHQNLADRYRNVIAIFMRQAMAGQPMTIFGDGSQTRAFTYVGDVVRLMADAAQTQACHGTVLNVGSDEVHSVADVARQVSRALGVPERLSFLPARHEAEHAYATHDRIRTLLGRGAETTFAEGLERMADWARTQPPQPPSWCPPIEVARGLPPSWAAGRPSTGDDRG